jgi:hypothetical protein
VIQEFARYCCCRILRWQPHPVPALVRFV